MILQRLLNGIYTVCFLTNYDSLQLKINFFLCPIIKNTITKTLVKGKGLISTLESSHIKSFRSSLQSHPLRVTLYIHT